MPSINLDKVRTYVLAIAETVRELGEVPSGHLYAQLMGDMDLDTYTSLIQVLEHAGLVRVQPSHLIIWVGPKRT